MKQNLTTLMELNIHFLNQTMQTMTHAHFLMFSQPVTIVTNTRRNCRNTMQKSKW